MKLGGNKVFRLFKDSAVDWSNDRAPQLGAALAFYTIFSLAPLLTILVSIAALWFTDNASQAILDQLKTVMGPQSAEYLEGMLVQPGQHASGIFTTISAGVMLVVGATAVFAQLQDSLNQVWEVKPKPGQTIMSFIRQRLLSFAMLLALAFLLLVSLVITTSITAVAAHFRPLFGDSLWLLHAANIVVSFVLITVLFAFLFKYVPDAEISWRDVWAGAVFTALLFSIGKFALGFYLGHSSLASTYRAAGSLILVLLWVYYNAQILFFGAEITQKYARMMGRAVQPSSHAEWDAGKQCQTEAANTDRERKKQAKGEQPKPKHQREPEAKPAQVSPRQPNPKPALAMRSAASPALKAHPSARHAEGDKPHGLKAKVGAALLVVLALLPFEKKLFRGKA